MAGDMEPLRLALGDTTLVITVLGRDVEQPGQPYFDWITCNVQISTPSFSGSVRWNVMPRELTALADDLVRLHGDFPKRGSVAFEPTEPNVVDGDRLHCRFTIEQSQLPTLAGRLRRFVEHATATP